MNSIQAILDCAILFMTSNKCNIRFSALLAVDLTEIYLKYPNTTYTRVPQISGTVLEQEVTIFTVN